MNRTCQSVKRGRQIITAIRPLQKLTTLLDRSKMSSIGLDVH